jgi:phosphatidylglycerophosphate synthase
LLARRGVTPNAISMLGVAFAIRSRRGACGWLSSRARSTSCNAADRRGCIQLRLLCNLLDGMLAVEMGLKTPTGELFNDLPDRIADVVILVGAGYAVRNEPYGLALGWSAAVFALFTAYVRVLGGSLGLTQHFIGPMAKQHRMFTLTLAAIIAQARRCSASRPARLCGGWPRSRPARSSRTIRRTNRIVAELSR